LAGWASPQASDWKNKSYSWDTALSTGRQFPLAGWNTLRSTDGTKGGPNQSRGALSHDAVLAGWATPTKRDLKDGIASLETNPVNSRLGMQIKLSGWSTPNAPRPHDTEASAGVDFLAQRQNWLGREVLGTKADSFTVATGASDGSRLNPSFSLWLIAGDSVTPELIATCPRGLVPSRRRATR
jgi:hypothetical protein